jgi:hypothetical protein
VQRIAIVVPSESNDAGFGLFASGVLQQDKLLACAERVIVTRGGQPVRRQEAGFVTVRDAKGAVSAAEIAVHDRGLLVIAEGAYLEQILATARGAHGALDEDGQLHALRAEVGQGEIRLSVVLSAAQRARLKHELRKRGADVAMLSHLQVAAGRVRIGDPLDLGGLIRCRTAAACQALAARLEAARQRAMNATGSRLLGLSRLLQRVTLRSDGAEIHLAARAPVADLEAVWERLRTLNAVEASPRPPPTMPALSASSSSVPAPSASSSPTTGRAEEAGF